MLASFAKSVSGELYSNVSWGNGFGSPNTLRTRENTSRTRWFSGKVCLADDVVDEGLGEPRK
eukprot:1178500-Alexandrium_andersonii.AAC.1